MALKIGPRIAVGFFGVLILLTLVGGISLYNFSGIRDDVSAYHEASDDAVMATSLQMAMMNARLSMKEFLLTGSADAEKDAAGQLRTMLTLVEQAGSRAQTAERQKHRADAVAAIEAYGKALGAVVQAHRALAEVRARKLDITGPALEAALNSAVAMAYQSGDIQAAYSLGEGARLLLSGRLYVQQYLDRHDKISADRVRRDFAAVRSKLDFFERTYAKSDWSEKIAQAVAAFPAYQAGFAEAEKLVQGMDKAVSGELNPAGERILAVAQGIWTSLKADQDGIGGRLAAQTDAVMTQTLVLVLMALAAGGAASYWIGVSISRPILRMTETMSRLARGDTSVEVPHRHKRDEIGAMASAVQVFKENAVDADRRRAEQELLRERGEEERKRALQSMADTIEREARSAVERIAGRTRDMANDAEAMADSADRVSQNAQSVAAAGEQALANVQAVAGATEELAAATNEIFGQMSYASAVAQRAVERGAAAKDTIRSLSDAMERIGQIADLIQSIAGQTNLLALNATIEAARAGDAGRGFAVVAQEVKNLATQTATSTEEITRRIAEIRGVTDSAVAAVEDIGGTIEEIDTVSRTVAAAMEKQAAATQDISRNVVQTSNAAREVSTRIAAVSHEADQTGAQAAQVHHGSGDVTDSIEALRHILVRIVRTSTGDADRRSAQRHPVDEPCTVEIAGRPQDGRLADLSHGGALVRMLSGAATGDHGVLRLDRHDIRLRFVVREAEPDGTHIEFDAADAEAQAWRAAMERLVAGSAPVTAAA